MYVCVAGMKVTGASLEERTLELSLEGRGRGKRETGNRLGCWFANVRSDCDVCYPDGRVEGAVH